MEEDGFEVVLGPEDGQASREQLAGITLEFSKEGVKGKATEDGGMVLTIERPHAFTISVTLPEAFPRMARPKLTLVDPDPSTVEHKCLLPDGEVTHDELKQWKHPQALGEVLRHIYNEFVETPPKAKKVTVAWGAPTLPDFSASRNVIPATPAGAAPIPESWVNRVQATPTASEAAGPPTHMRDSRVLPRSKPLHIKENPLRGVEPPPAPSSFPQLSTASLEGLQRISSDTTKASLLRLASAYTDQLKKTTVASAQAVSQLESSVADEKEKQLQLALSVSQESDRLAAIKEDLAVALVCRKEIEERRATSAACTRLREARDEAQRDMDNALKMYNDGLSDPTFLTSVYQPLLRDYHLRSLELQAALTG